MPEYLIALALTTALGAASFLLRRIDGVDSRVDKLELKVAETYVTKETMYRILDRLEGSLSRMEEKLDAHVFEDPEMIKRLRDKYQSKTKFTGDYHV